MLTLASLGKAPRSESVYLSLSLQALAPSNGKSLVDTPTNPHHRFSLAKAKHFHPMLLPPLWDLHRAKLSQEV